MDAPRECYTEWSESDISYDIPYMWNLKINDRNEFTCRTDSQTSRMSLWLQGEESGRGDGWGVWAMLLFSHQVVSNSSWPHLLQHSSLPVPHHLPEFDEMYTLLYLKWMTNKDLLYSTWNLAQCYVAAWMGEDLGEEWIHVYIWLNPFAFHLKLSQPVVNWLYTLAQNKNIFLKKSLMRNRIFM